MRADFRQDDISGDRKGPYLSSGRKMCGLSVCKERLDVDLMLRTVDYIKVHEKGVVVTVFLEGTEIEWKN